MADPQRYALILMDLQMPVMSGYEATVRIRERDGSVPIIALTAAAMVEDRQKALDAGMNDHLGKPIDAGELYRVIAAWTGNDPHPCPVAAGESSKAAVVLDREYALRLVGNNEELMAKLMAKMARSLERDFGHIVAQVRSGDPEAPAQIHALKGVSGNIGAMALWEVVGRIDAGYRQNGVPTEGEITELAAAIEALKAELAPYRAREEQVERLNVPGDIGVLFESVQNDLAHGSIVSPEDHAALLAGLKGKVPSEELRSWNDAMEEFDYDQALEGMKKWKIG
jgi:HPt (histidine-containing phosphotransfer) domain-containing protein